MVDVFFLIHSLKMAQICDMREVLHDTNIKKALLFNILLKWLFKNYFQNTPVKLTMFCLCSVSLGHTPKFIP